MNSRPQPIGQLERGDCQLTLQWSSRLAVALGCQRAAPLPETLPRAAVGTEDPREAAALLEIFRALSASVHEVFLKIANAMAQSNTILTGLLRSSR